MYGLLDIQGNLKNETMYEAIRTLEKDHSYTERGVDACQNETLYKNVTQNDIAYEFFKCFKNYTDTAYYWSILKYLLNKQSVYVSFDCSSHVLCTVFTSSIPSSRFDFQWNLSQHLCKFKKLFPHIIHFKFS